MTAKNEMWLNMPLLGGYQRITPESNPVTWAYAHGSDLGGNLDNARGEWYEEKWDLDQLADWHRGVASDSWRCKDGSSIRICDMNDFHLGHAIRFAQTKSQHHSRIDALTTEFARRRK
jgi:hypothetical protein